ncbi:P-loop NTPase fold protein [Undibacterium sp. Ji50W]|uniref:P-loop NTPase fold protein n=1 Tax=Undibacterium sp. Ji50W TaxID=3413041 RepID=UPI003BF3D9A6
MSKHETITGYKFNILNEVVAEKDLFEDQTHAQVSENLFNLIQSSNKGVTIGLEGNWGSGKSTVINLLKDQLIEDKNQKAKFFMFDAWAHDGDPLRRIFLESLIKEMDPDGQDDYLLEIEKEITGRKKTVSVESKKSASQFGKLLSFVALTIPLGTALLGKVNYEIFKLPWSNDAGSIYWLFFLGLFFLFISIYFYRILVFYRGRG